MTDNIDMSEYSVDESLLAGQSTKNKRHIVEFEGDTLLIDSDDWRESNLLKFQILTGFIVFLLFGMADQTLGTLIPIFQKEYHINDIQTSLIFISAVSGYFTLAFLSEISHSKIGVRGVGIVGTMLMAAAYLLLSFHPPYFVIVLAYMLNGIGCGSMDAALSMFMGFLVDSNEILGMLHGFYGVGCMISPPLITYLLERKNNPWPWNRYYLLLCVLAATSSIFFVLFYKHETPQKFKYSNVAHHNSDNLEMHNLDGSKSNLNSIELSIANSLEGSVADDIGGSPDLTNPIKHTATTSDIVKSLTVWLYAFSLFLYVGTESSFGSWIVTYSTRVLQYTYKNSSYLASSFWTGLTAGRIVLGFVTSRLFRTELRANVAYFSLSLGGYFLFWICCYNATMWVLFIVAFGTGFFVGPIFPTTIVCILKTLPKSFHAAAVGFSCAFGGGGAAALPFIIGTIAQLNFKIFPAIITLFALSNTILWVLVNRRSAGSYSSNKI